MNLDPLAGVAVGAALTYAGQWATERRTIRRDAAKAKVAAAMQRKAEWKALQVQTILDLQEEMEAMATTISVQTTRTVGVALGKIPTMAETRAALAPIGRLVLLCTRLQDQVLAEEIRSWISDMTQAVTTKGRRAELATSLKERRNYLQERLGDELRQFHPEPEESSSVVSIAAQRRRFLRRR
ncbi:hypothetical protein [Streptacidiphilus sp. EB103A]|uniref:hypothetical protein n=1 Tax=Streptacidiphilus sp. EB103A TaxID=3156275 RepID=UPI003518C7B0